MAVPEEYFTIPESEFQDIKAYILTKFRPITERGGRSQLAQRR